jgi:hypothetical protein
MELPVNRVAVDWAESCCGSMVAYADVYAALLFAVEKDVE